MRASSKRWIWFFVFVLLLSLAAFFLTTSNLVFFDRVETIWGAFRSSPIVENPRAYFESLRYSWLLGILASLIALTGLVVFFLKSQHEMSLNLRQKEFFARASHELRSPVTSIQLSSSLLKNSQENWTLEQSKLWDLLEAELLRLRLEMDSVLEASKTEVFGIEPRWQNLELELWVKSKVPLWKQMLGPGAQWHREGEALHVFIETDPRWLELIVNNLIDNSRKYTKEAESPSVTLRTGFFESPLGPAWFLEFEDQGQGFPSQEAKKIFRRFHRTEEAVSSRPGSGLGLFLVKKGVEALRLHVEARSRGSGQGACFRIWGSL